MLKNEKNKRKNKELDSLNKIVKIITLYQQQIDNIMESGEVAAPGCWIIRYQARGRKNRYWYYKLHATEEIFPTRNPEKKSKYKHLGKAGSPAYLNGVASVLRRSHIDGLERAINTLELGLTDLTEKR